MTRKMFAVGFNHRHDPRQPERLLQTDPRYPIYVHKG